MTTQAAPNSAPAWQPQASTPPLPRILNPGFRRMMLPPADAIRPHDERVANALQKIRTLEGEEYKAAMDYQKATSWGEALREDTKYVRDFIHNHNRLPSPQQGPHAGNFRQIEALHTQAFRYTIWVDVAREDLVAYLKCDHRLQHSLSDHCDELRDQIQDHWVRARDQKDRRAYEDGKDLCAAWTATNRLHAWALSPSMDYQDARGSVFPGELAVLEWEADAAVNGKARAEVPVSALQLPGAPPPADAPIGGPPAPIRLSGEGTAVNGQPVRQSFFRRG